MAAAPRRATEGRGEGEALPLLVASAHAVADRDGAARHEPYGYRADDEDDGGGVANRDKARLADDVAHDAHIDELVDVLRRFAATSGAENAASASGRSLQKRWRMICGY